MKTCQVCRGAIFAVGEVALYAGPLCSCPQPQPPSLLLPTPGLPVAPMRVFPSTLMAPADFVVWLRGYLTAFGGTANSMDRAAWATIIQKLDSVSGPK